MGDAVVANAAAPLAGVVEEAVAINDDVHDDATITKNGSKERKA